VRNSNSAISISRLNLTFEVREGIINIHPVFEAEAPQLAEYLLDLQPPLEAQLIDCVDEIAYNTADIDDALEAKILDLERFAKKYRCLAGYQRVHAVHPSAKEN